VAIDADGRIVAGGVSGRPNRADFALARYNSDGSLDQSFDGDGRLTTRFGSRRDIANSVAIDARGRIVAGGYKGNGAPTLTSRSPATSPTAAGTRASRATAS
jgi:hypothetical protein